MAGWKAKEECRNATPRLLDDEESKAETPPRAGECIVLTPSVDGGEGTSAPLLHRGPVAKTMRFHAFGLWDTSMSALHWIICTWIAHSKV